MSSADVAGTAAGALNGSAGTTREQTRNRFEERTAAEIAARLDRLPASRYFWKVILLVSLGGWFEYYDLIYTGYIAPGLTSSGLLTTTTTTFFGYTGIAGFIAATFAGLFVGTFFCGRLADRFGRRAAFTWSMAWYSIASFVMAFQTTPEGLLIWRFIGGIGIGVEIIIVTTFIIEMVPGHMRGKAIALNQAIMFTGSPIAALLSAWLVPTSYFGLDGWRWIVLIGSTGAIVVCFLRAGLPETPRWLAQRGRREEALKIVEHIEEQVVRETGRPLADPAPVKDVAPAPQIRFLELLTGSCRQLVLTLLIFNAFQAIGYYGFTNWVPTLLIAKGIVVTKSLLYTSVIALASPIGPLLGMLVADRVERKWLIVVSAAAISALGLAFSQATGPALLVVLGVLINLSNSMMSLSFHTYQNEVFPTRIRARAASVVYSASRVSAMFSGFLMAFLLRDYGVTGAFAAITGSMIVVMIAIGVFGPATNNKPLEQISA
jgi:putative MFS transporter